MINLTKGETMKISSNQFVVGLGWDTKCDLDAHAYLYEEEIEKPAKKGFFTNLFGGGSDIDNAKEHIYFMNKKSKNGAVVLTGDNLTGEGDGDDEQIIINLDLISDKIKRICFKVHIFSGAISFSSIKGAFIRIVDERSGEEICRYNLTTAEIKGRDYVFGNLIKQPDGDWVFKADE